MLTDSQFWPSAPHDAAEVFADYLLYVDDKDGLVWFADGAFLALTLLCKRTGIPNKHRAVVAAAEGGRPRNSVVFCHDALP